MHLFFDLDNTLLDDSKTKDHYLPKLFSEFGSLTSRDYASFRQSWTEAIPKFYNQYLSGKLSFAEQRFARIKAALGNESLTAAAVAEVDEAFLRYFEESWRLFKGWKEYFEGSRVAKSVITNGNPDQQRRKLERLGLGGAFSQLIISEEVGSAKPDQRIFEAALAGASCPAQQCYMIGDSFEHDIVGALGVGIRPLWIDHHQEAASRDQPGVEVFSSIPALIARLEALE